MWWKILSVVIILYSLIAGLLVPLGPGIVEVRPGSAKTGETVVLEVTGYNSNYTVGDVRAWLKLDSEHGLRARDIDVLDDRRLRVTFDLPNALPVDKKVQDLTLVTDNPSDGAAVLPSALFVTNQGATTSTDGWQQSTIESLHSASGMNFPFRNILGETIRNTYYHVPLWFAMMIIFIAAVVYSIRFLRHRRTRDDHRALALTQVGILYGILGLVTGAIWAKHTWGAYWSFDPKQNMAAIAILIYLAYLILRNSFDDVEKRARIGAVYNIFAFSTLIPLLYIIPRLVDSLHPGAGGNPAFGGEDLDNTMRTVFYPAIIGWTLFGVWMATLLWRTYRLRDRAMELDPLP